MGGGRRKGGAALVLGGALFVVFTAGPVAAQGAGGSRSTGRLKLFGGRYSVLLGGATATPVAADTRDVYGSWPILPGIQLWSFDGGKGTHFAWDLGGRSFGKEGSRATFYSLSAGVGWSFVDGDRPAVPYVLLRAGPYLARASPGGYQVVPGGNAELGVALFQRLVLAVRYDEVGRVDGVNVSAFGASAMVRVF